MLKKLPVSIFPWCFTIPLIIAAFGVSTFFTGTNSIYFAPVMLMIVAFGFFAVFPRILQKLELPNNKLGILLAAWIFYVFVSSTWSAVPYLSIQFALFFAIVPFMVFTAMQTGNMYRWSQVHTVAILSVFAGLAVWAMIQYTFLFDQVPTKRVSHPMLNPNSLAGLFNMALVASVALFIWAEKRAYQIGSYLLVILLFAGLMATQSRAGVIFEAVAILVLIAVMWRYPGLSYKKLAMLALGMVVVPFVMDIIQPTALEKNITRYMGDPSTQRSMDDRVYLIQSTWEIIKTHPWLGTGLSTFYFFYPEHRLPMDRSDGFFVHVDPLQFWAEMGILAPVLFYSILTAVLLRTIKAVKALPQDSYLKLEIMATFCALLAIVMHSHMTFHLYILAMLIPVGILFAYWYAATEKALGAEDRLSVEYGGADKKLKKALVLFLVIGSFVMAGQWSARAGVGVYYTSQGLENLQKRDFQTARAKLDKASAIAPQSYYRMHQLQAGVIVNLMNALQNKLSREEQKALYEEALVHLKRAQEVAEPFQALHSEEARLYFMVDGIFIEDGMERGEEILLRVLEKNPMSWDARLGLSKIYKKRGQLQKAVDILEEGRAWPMPRGPMMVQIFAEMARLYESMGDKSKAQELMYQAQRWMRKFGQRPRR